MVIQRQKTMASALVTVTGPLSFQVPKLICLVAWCDWHICAKIIKETMKNFESVIASVKIY